MSVLRLIDANANRAREALRVLEDYARFVLDDDRLCADLKQLRHALQGALAQVLPEAILHRDVQGDVGTDNKTSAELTRSDPHHVVVAAGKRLTEALRSLEEYLKIDHPHLAQQVERCRYDAYGLEQRLAVTLRRPGDRLAAARLYVLITESACRSGDWLTTARAAIEGGADVLQLREKDLDSGPLLARARQFVRLCRDHGVLSIINDRTDIALLADADGVHLGQTDLPPLDARKLLGPHKLLGVSTHHPDHARAARLASADYIGAGPVYRSPTKPRDINPGLDYLRELQDFAGGQCPVFAIAGITEARVPEIVATGTRRIAVTSAVTGADDPAAACRRLKTLLNA